MKIYSMGEGIPDESVKDVAKMTCILLVCDSHEEMGAALRDIQFRDAVTVVRAPADRELHALRAKVLGIDPFSNPIGALQRLQADLSAPVVATPVRSTPPSGAAADEKGGA